MTSTDTRSTSPPLYSAGLTSKTVAPTITITASPATAGETPSSSGQKTVNNPDMGSDYECRCIYVRMSLTSHVCL